VMIWGDERRVAGAWLGVVVVQLPAEFVGPAPARRRRFPVARAASACASMAARGRRHPHWREAQGVYDVTTRKEFNFAWQDDCGGDMREGGALLQVESRGRNCKDSGSLLFTVSLVEACRGSSA
jgi:hypothetical protein